MTTFVLLCFAALAGVNDGPAAPSLFGVPLGISEQQFSELAHKSKIRPSYGYSKSTYGEPGSGMVQRSASYKGTVNPVPGPSATTVWFVDGRVYKVTVTLADVSEKGWERIKHKLAEKYEKHGKGSPGEYVAATPLVHVKADFSGDSVTMGYRGRVSITYTDARIVKELAERMKKRVPKNDAVELDKNL